MIRRQISQVALLAYFILLLLSTFFPAIPGQSLWFRLLVLLAIVPLLVGPELYHLAGFATLILAIVLLRGDIKYGKIYQEKRLKRIHSIMQDRDINR